SVEQQKFLFEPYRQADTTVSRKYGGTGLGLVLARNIARALGGDVTLDFSEMGKGSVFKVVIEAEHTNDENMVETITPLESVKSFESNLPPKQSLEGCRILVVDDTMDSQNLVRRFLEKAGAQVDCANNGAEAITKALESSPDIILMDIQMPI